jgi:phage-related protein
MSKPKMRDLVWVGSSRDDVREFPEEARREAGFALRSVQGGEMPSGAKPLQGFGSAGVQEIVIREDGDTYRVVYTVTLPDAVYVLHAFMKKSKTGIKTAKNARNLIAQRLRAAREISAIRVQEGRGIEHDQRQSVHRWKRQYLR